MPTVIYGLDNGNNRVETMTTEQILTAIAQAQQGESVLDYDNAFITQIKEINNGYQMKFWIGTQAEYNVLQAPENNVLYIISDDHTKEELIQAVEDLSATVGTFQTVLANKQNTLTFDTAPTQGSTNPVTSAGIYDAIATSKVQRTVLWQRQAGDTSSFKAVDDEITLAQAISGFDFIEVQLAKPNVAGGIGVDLGKQFFEASGNISVRWNETSVAQSNAYARLISCDVTIGITNTTATITTVGYMTTNFYYDSTTSNYDETTALARIYRITGVKI